MFERANTVLPIIPSIELNGINYEYYNHAIFSSATFEKSGSNPALVQFASKYQQELLPWAPASNQLYYDTASGQQPYPAVWATFFESQAGKIELAQQLAEALELLNLGTNVTTPADFIEAGITYPNETFVQWADRVDLPAYSGISDTWWYAVCADPCVECMCWSNATAPSSSQ